MNLVRTGILGCAVALAAPAATETRVPDAGLAAMRSIAFLEGRWEGEGTLRRGPGEPMRFTSAETVAARLDGRILTVEGSHRDATNPERVVRNAFAVISYDEAAGRFAFHSIWPTGTPETTRPS